MGLEEGVCVWGRRGRRGDGRGGGWARCSDGDGRGEGGRVSVWIGLRRKRYARRSFWIGDGAVVEQSSRCNIDWVRICTPKNDNQVLPVIDTYIFGGKHL